MFQCGQRVVYGSHGVCDIIGVEMQTVGRKKVEYFVLEPLGQPGARYYVPTQNERALSKLQPLLTKDAIDQLLKSELDFNEIWIHDENQRKQRYRELISSADRAALIRMIRALCKHRQDLIDTGKKFHLSDENFLKDAEKLLSAEFALVLNISADEACAYIEQTIG